MSEQTIISNKPGGLRPKGSSSRTEEEIIEIFEERGYTLGRNQEVKNGVKLLAYNKEGYKVLADTSRLVKGRNPVAITKKNPHSLWNIKNVWLPLNAPEYSLLEDTYVDGKTKMKWRLNNSHYPDFEMTWNLFSRTKRHPIIGKLMTTKTSTEDILSIIKGILENDERYTNWELAIEDDYEYMDSKDYIFFKDNNGYIACQTVHLIRNGYGLQKYKIYQPEVSTFNLYHWDKTENKNERLKENQTYTGGTSKYIFICEEHGEIEKWMHDAFNGVKCLQCLYDSRKGEGNGRWNPELTNEDRDRGRLVFGYADWRAAVYERDSYSCQCCGDSSGGNLNAHHKDGYNWCRERRTDVTNGVTLCEECHVNGDYSFHKLYGKGENTEDQFNEWISAYQSIIINYKSKEII